MIERRPVISIVTPSFNQGGFLQRTIESVLSQTGPFEVEYLVMDGGSTDNTLDILRGYDRQTARAGDTRNGLAGHRLSWRSEGDRGQADAINKGLRQARGDILGWLNSDDVLAPGALAQVAAAFAVDPAVRWVHGRCEMIDANDRTVRRMISRYKDWFAQRYTLRGLLRQNFISQMTVFWRRDLLEQVGFLDEGLHYAMDYDLWLRFAKISPPHYIAAHLASFRWYDQSKSGTAFEDQFREDYEVFARHAPNTTTSWDRLQKRLTTQQILAAYHMFRFARAALARGQRWLPV